MERFGAWDLGLAGWAPHTRHNVQRQRTVEPELYMPFKARPAPKIKGKPTIYEILVLHKLYIKRLKEVYDKYKHLYPQRKGELNFVDKVDRKTLREWEKNFDIGSENEGTATELWSHSKL